MEKNIMEDIALVNVIKRGDKGEKEKAMSKLYNKYKKTIMYKYGFNNTSAEDLVADVFEKAYLNIHKFNSEKGAFSTWLFNMSRNLFIDNHRKESIKIQTTSIDEMVRIDKHDEGIMELEGNSKTPEEICMESEDMELNLLKKRIREELKSHNERYRIIFELRFFHDFSYEQIAVYLESPLGTVKANLFRAKEILKDKIKVK